MKIAMINDSGNVGKSLLSRELFYQNMKNGIIIEVETSNSSSAKFASNGKINLEKIYGDEFDKLFSLMYQYDEFVVDVGKSQLERFLKELSKSSEILNEFDFIVVPVTSDNRLFAKRFLKKYGKSFFIALMILRKWKPEHYTFDMYDYNPNVMVRPSTKELVIMDPLV